jgi:hypothetical protein
MEKENMISNSLSHKSNECSFGCQAHLIRVEHSVKFILEILIFGRF